MRFFSIVGAAVLLLLVSVQHSRAQNAASVVPYQGKVSDQNGAAITPGTPMILVFRIYTSPVGGVPLWQEVHDNVSVQNGYFSALLGSRTPFPSRQMFNSTVYIGITYDDGNPLTADVELRPRQALAPTMAAIHAMTADDAKRAEEATHAAEADLAKRATVADSVPSIIGEVPIGGVVPFFGEIGNIPANWRNCDGAVVSDASSPFNGKAVPNLSGLFVRGVEDASPLGSVAGNDNVPDHSHSVYGNGSVYIPMDTLIGWNRGWAPVTRANGLEYDGTLIDIARNQPPDGTSHAHSGSANINGRAVDAGAHDNRPKFMSLYYIIRIR